MMITPETSESPENIMESPKEDNNNPLPLINNKVKRRRKNVIPSFNGISTINEFTIMNDMAMMRQIKGSSATTQPALNFSSISMKNETKEKKKCNSSTSQSSNTFSELFSKPSQINNNNNSLKKSHNESTIVKTNNNNNNNININNSVIQIKDFSDGEELHSFMCKKVNIKTRCDSSTLTEIRTYIKSPPVKPLMLYGPPGCGKSQLINELKKGDKRIIDLSDEIMLFLDQMKLDNDVIDSKIVKSNIIGKLNFTILYKHPLVKGAETTVVVLDEFDCYPKFLVDELFELIKSGMRNHLIVICNDPYSESLKRHRTKCHVIKMNVINFKYLNRYMQYVNKLCGKLMTTVDVERLIINSNCDVRSVFNNYIFYSKSSDSLKNNNVSSMNLTTTTNIFSIIHSLRSKPYDVIENFIRYNPFIITLLQLNYEKYFLKLPKLFFHFFPSHNNCLQLYEWFSLFDVFDSFKYNGVISSNSGDLLESYIISMTSIILQSLRELVAPSYIDQPRQKSYYKNQSSNKFNFVKYNRMNPLNHINNHVIKTGRGNFLLKNNEINEKNYSDVLYKELYTYF